MQFNNELRKLKKKKSGQGTDENYVSTWEYFTSLQFLIPSTVPANETQQNLVSCLYYLLVYSLISTFKCICTAS